MKIVGSASYRACTYTSKYKVLYNYTMLWNAYTLYVCVMYAAVDKGPFPPSQKKNKTKTNTNYTIHSVTLHTQI
jgi:hypothetical protein